MRAKLWIRFVQQLLAAGMLLASAAAYSQTRYPVDLPSQPLEDSLRAIGRITGTNVVFSPQAVRGKTAQAVKGEYTAEEALGQVVANTPLEARRSSDTTVIIRERNEGGDKAEPKAAEKRSEQSTGRQEAVRGESIVVTAQKREELLLDVPVPVTAIPAATLVSRGQRRLEDYYALIPGLNLTLSGNTAAPFVAIRGVTTGGVFNPTVGIVIDDIPFGSSTVGSGGGNVAPDIDPSELQRVEVLRGPQGALYGANAMGGLIKYVTVDPSTAGLSGSVQAGTSTVQKGDEPGYSLRAAINLPLSEVLALRLSGSTRRDPGYIDNLATGEAGVNRTDSDSARLALLFQPSARFYLKLSALYQHTTRQGAPDVHLPCPAAVQSATCSGRSDLGDLEQTALRGTGVYESEYQAYSAIMRADLGPAELVSLTGYSDTQIRQLADRTLSFGFLTQPRFGFRGAAQLSRNQTPRFSQELRVSMPVAERVQWLLGAFYVREKYPSQPNIVAIDPATGALVAELAPINNEGNFRELAAFTNVTVELSDRFDVQLGARYSENKFNSGPLVAAVSPVFPAGSFTPKFSAKDDAFTYLVTPRFRMSDDLMIYARLASGYRPGGPNTSPTALAAGLPAQFGPDTTQTYEIGTKGTAWGVFTFDASIYQIDWKDVQLNLSDPDRPMLTYTLNAGEARSRGAELSLVLRPTSSLTIAGVGAFTDAEFTGVPTTSVLTARAGDRLPYSPRWSGSLSVDQTLPLAARATGYVGGTLSYVGDRSGAFFAGGTDREVFPGYTQLNLRAGVKMDGWSIDAFINNVTDKRGIFRSGRDAAFGLRYAVTYIQPRTAGISLTRQF